MTLAILFALFLILWVVFTLAVPNTIASTLLMFGLMLILGYHAFGPLIRAG